jgi:hypothetical protein
MSLTLWVEQDDTGKEPVHSLSWNAYQDDCFDRCHRNRPVGLSLGQNQTFTYQDGKGSTWGSARQYVDRKEDELCLQAVKILD